MIAYGSIIINKYGASRKDDEFGEADISVISTALDIKEFKLSDPNYSGMKRADMTGNSVLRLPNNAHFPTVYAIGGTCGSSEVGNITQVKNGEENFYIGNPKFSDFQFFVIKGTGLNCYNLPPCVDKVGIETTYTSGDTDISLDMAFDVSAQVFALLFKEKMIQTKILDNSYDPSAVDFKHRLVEQQNELNG